MGIGTSFAPPGPGSRPKNSYDAQARINLQATSASFDVESDTVAVAAPDLTVTKANDVGGATNLGKGWDWTLTVAKSGQADATFSDGQTIQVDHLPNTAISYGAPFVGSTSDVTNWANISCGIVAQTLTCSASGADVTIGASTGTFTHQVSENEEQAVARIQRIAPASVGKTLAGRPPDETVIERVAIGQMVQAALEQRRDGLRGCLIPSLREVALDLVVNPLMGDSMVANVALLLDRAGREALDRRLEALDEEFEGRLTFRRVGPLPPYSFATVEVEVPSFEAIDEGRRRLGLGEAATPGEIKRAYHRLAGQLHPDHNPDDPEAEARMTELTQAYELLTAYAENLQRIRGAEDRQSETCTEPSRSIRFSQEAVERTLLTAIRRQEVVA